MMENRIYCKNCLFLSQTLEQNNNFKYFWYKKCTKFNSKLSISCKKCKRKFKKEIHIGEKNMKVVKMISWDDTEIYPQCSDQRNFIDFWNYTKNFLIKNNIKFNGSYHQNWEYGVPIIENDGNLYAFTLSMRRWGKLMAEAFDPNNKNPLSYVDWAFGIPEGVVFTIDDDRDPMLLRGNGDKI